MNKHEQIMEAYKKIKQHLFRAESLIIRAGKAHAKEFIKSQQKDKAA